MRRAMQTKFQTTTLQTALMLTMAATTLSCDGSSKVLKDMAGGWVGQITVPPGTVPMPPIAIGGNAEWNDAEKLLSGTFAVQDPAPDTTHTYAIRRSDVVSGVVYLEMTDILVPTRGLTIEGELNDSFTGTATVRYPCASPTGTCGYVGTLSMTRGAPPPIPTGDTGNPPETGLPVDTAGDTGGDTGTVVDTGGDTAGDTGGDTGGRPPGDTSGDTGP